MKKKIIISSMILSLIIFIVIYFQVWQYIKPNILKNYIESFGAWTIAIYCLIYLIAVFIPYAGTTMTIVGGLIFAPAFGTALVITISTLGSIVPFYITKKIAREKIKTKLEKTKYKKYLEHTNKNSFTYVLYMRLITIIPYELQNYIIGLIDISVKKFIIATFVGLLPGTFFLIYLGNTITNVSPRKIIFLGLISLFALFLPIVLKKFTKAKDILEK